MGIPTRLTGVLAVLALAAPGAAQERYALGGDHVAIYNLAGEIEVVGTRSGQVTVELARGGRDGDRLGVEVGAIAGRQTLRVVYPAGRIVYRGMSPGSRTSTRIRADGTWGRGMDGLLPRGQRVEIAGRGSGLEAHADLRIGVPRGQRIDIHLAAGRITARNVDGRVRLDTHSGPVSAREMSGALTIDTGSGGVDVDGMDGDLDIDTGSGGVRVARVRGERVSIDTGSGRVTADQVSASDLNVDTGSGRIVLTRAAAPNVRLDTGSGSVEAELGGPIDRLVVDTGSGSVTLRLPENVGAALDIRTGSGGIDVALPVSVTTRSRSRLRGEIGDGRGSIKIDTGSGSVRLRRL